MDAKLHRQPERVTVVSERIEPSARPYLRVGHVADEPIAAIDAALKAGGPQT
jgi:hypothetical protein